MMAGEKPVTFDKVRKIVYSDNKIEIYRIDNDVYQIILQQPYVVIIYNLTRNIIYYTFSMSGYGVDQLVELLDWSKIREIIQSTRS